MMQFPYLPTQSNFISKRMKRHVHVIPVITLLVMLFVFSKTVGFIHGEVHPFHHHTEQCEIYQSLGHPIDDRVFTLDFLLFPPNFSFPVATAFLHVSISRLSGFLGRAPPMQ
ncbi:hypothetical protein [Hydrogenovibrio sp. JE_KL2]|uniref:hypothetical protein n=1 Tax=Hydrogenovibrio sp. JE_KL2 TaxID=2651188 RepID=UPI00128C7C21|nr:hypothetical protein [Hydrogenovibrio sp. JE_KL2]MPQ76384.1 hypothetical protein [Hydrogenovibrio sp. JE_KL2]